MRTTMVTFDTEGYAREKLPEYDKDYRQPQVLVQFAEIMDSEDNPIELTEVRTDDNKSYKLSIQQVKYLYNKLMKLKPHARQEICRRIQYSSGFSEMMQLLLNNKI
jgi:hypothetical protein